MLHVSMHGKDACSRFLCGLQHEDDIDLGGQEAEGEDVDFGPVGLQFGVICMETLGAAPSTGQQSSGRASSTSGASRSDCRCGGHLAGWTKSGLREGIRRHRLCAFLGADRGGARLWHCLWLRWDRWMVDLMPRELWGERGLLSLQRFPGFPVLCICNKGVLGMRARARSIYLVDYQQYTSIIGNQRVYTCASHWPFQGSKSIGVCFIWFMPVFW
jgi:hypothetical protein